MDDNKYELLEVFLGTFELEDLAGTFIPSGVVGMVKKAWNHRQNRKVEKYLEGFYLSIENNNINKEQLVQHQSVMDGKNKQIVFLDILEFALKSSAEKSAQLLGYYAGKTLVDDRVISYDDELIIHALSHLNDWDLENLQKVFNYFDKYKDNRSGATSTAIYFDLNMEDFEDAIDKKEISDYEILNNVQLKRFKSTLKKLSSFQLLDEGALYMYTDAVSFLMSDLGKSICDLLKKIE